jgi:hypothetical protein
MGYFVKHHSREYETTSVRARNHYIALLAAHISFVEGSVQKPRLSLLR